MGVIEAERSEGGHWRIPVSEVERLQREGVPPCPLPDHRVQTETVPPQLANSRTDLLLAPPSTQAIASAESVLKAENRVRELKLRQEEETTLDWFRERKQQKAERKTLEHAQAEQRRVDAEIAPRRARFSAQWLDVGLRLMPDRVPGNVQGEVRKKLKSALDGCDPSEPEETTLKLVLAVLAEALGPWLRSKEIEAAVQEACGTLPSAAHGFSWSPTEWDLKARKAADAAVGQLPDPSSLAEIQAATKLAVAAVVKEYELQKAAKDDAETRVYLTNWACLGLGFSDEEKSEARRAIKAAFAKLPMGTSRRELEIARDEALRPFQERVVAQRQKAQFLDQQFLFSAVSEYLRKLHEDGQVELEPGESLADATLEMEELVRQELVETLDGTESNEEVKKQVRQLVRAELGL